MQASDLDRVRKGDALPTPAPIEVAERNDARMTLRPPESVDRPIERSGGLSVWRQITERLERDIRSGRLPAGARLPNEAAMAERFAVNRHTVRRALAELAAKGLVRASAGRGTFIEPPKLAYAIGPRTRFSENVEHEGREASGELLAAETVAAPATIARRLKIRVGAKVLRITLRRRADGIPVVFSTSWLPLPRFARLAERYGVHGSISAALADCGVADYRRAETRIAAREAAADEAAALDIAPRRIVLALDSLNVDAEGTPIQATLALFSADRVELVVAS